jgi:hypothetical protein
MEGSVAILSVMLQELRIKIPLDRLSVINDVGVSKQSKVFLDPRFQIPVPCRAVTRVYVEY